ncbi:MAG: hypothetical protein HYS17_00850 [Micavibrio aeruginosavorus]|uniref:ATP-grasp domain-containing protein n=1 Tax=Micavibrio aeruginosavorus TaxID=349221 RepID=A0A7T5R2J6_9BACT|nr:MAG: hypothetical protein HYS17_00850 [Micavibrio aeruginosavorus]
MEKSLRNQTNHLPYDEVVMLHDHPYPESTDDELFNIALAKDLGAIIRTLGVETTCLAFCDSSLDILRRKKTKGDNFVVFNLVENVERKPEWQPRAMQALEDIGVAFTGTSAEQLLACDADKFRMKESLLARGLPTPLWATRNHIKPLYTESGPWLVKSALYHGSFNIRQDSISEDPAYLLSLMQRYEDAHGGLWFAEQFLDGREFYIGLIGRKGEKPYQLPVAEVVYDQEFFSQGRYALLTEDGKWDEDGSEFRAIRTTFDSLRQERELEQILQDMAERCWLAMDLNGYARIDFRADRDGRPYILEINTNPYLGINDSYIFQPAASAGLSVADVLEKIILCAHGAK